MANYITKADIEAIFGVTNVVKWSNLDNDDAQANAARIDSAIAYAESYVDDKFRQGRYDVPVIGTAGTTPEMVVDMAAKMAGVWLYNTRRIRNREDDEVGQVNQGHQDEVDSLLAEYVSGQRVLPAERSHSFATAPQVVG